MPWFLGGSYMGGRFLMGERPLYTITPTITIVAHHSTVGRVVAPLEGYAITPSQAARERACPMDGVQGLVGQVGMVCWAGSDWSAAVRIGPSRPVRPRPADQGLLPLPGLGRTDLLPLPAPRRWTGRFLMGEIPLYCFECK